MENKKRILIFVAAVTIFVSACSLSGSSQEGDGLNGDQLAMSATQRAVQMTETALAQPPIQAVVPTLVEAVPTQPSANSPVPTESVATQVVVVETPMDKAKSGIAGAMIAYDFSAVGDIVSEYQYAAEEGPYQYPHPVYVRFNLAEWDGVISIVPVDRMAQVYDETYALIAALQADINTPQKPGTGCINELPLTDFFHHCSHQEFLASPAKVDFVNGTGMRFVTVYAIQDFAPIDNQHLRYVYQGLSHDGQCYISADFALLHEDLPETDTFPAEFYTATSEDVAEYFGVYADGLSEAEAGYIPTLDVFDGLIESLEVIQCGVDQ